MKEKKPEKKQLQIKLKLLKGSETSSNLPPTSAFPIKKPKVQLEQNPGAQSVSC